MSASEPAGGVDPEATPPTSTERAPVGAPHLFAGVFAITLFALSWARHHQLRTGFDLAIFDQAVWQLSEGRTHISIVDRHVLADHLSPVLYALSPLYRVTPTVLWLFAVQAAAAGFTVLAMRRVAMELGTPGREGLLLAAGSAPLMAAVLFDFHPSTLAVPFISLALAAGLAGRVRPTVGWALLVLLCRADLALVLLGTALVARGRARLALALLAGLGAIVGTVAPGWFGPTNGWRPHFGHLGESPLDAALHPWEPMAELLSGPSLTTVLVWVLAAGGLVVLKPRWVLAVVVAGAPVLLSSWEGTELPWYHYGAPIAPLAIGGTLAWLAENPGRRGPLRQVGFAAPLMAVMLFSPFSPLAPERSSVWGAAKSDDRQPVLEVLHGVGPGEAVSASQEALAHLSQRTEAYVFPFPFAPPSGYFAPGSAPEPGGVVVDVVIARRSATSVVPKGFAVERQAGDWVLLRRQRTSVR